MEGNIGRRILVVLVVASAIASCGTPPHRDRKFDDRELNAVVGFLATPGVSRAVVEARIGPPRSTFESGRVVAYRFAFVRRHTPAPSFPGSRPYGDDVLEWQSQPRSAKGATGPQVMIEYDDDGKVLRFNILE